jgi:hypothetical protein
VRKWLFSVVAGAFLALPAVSALAQSQTFVIDADGAQEIVGGQPNRGDPNGRAIGTLMLNPGTGGNTGSADFHLMLSNLDYPLTLYHIHTGAAGVQGGVFIDFGNPETIRSGDMMMGTVTGLSTANINTVLGNPAGYYLNIHNGPFGAGAVRDQLPEPGAISLLAVAGLALLRRRRSAI